ncbi:hypothetical protein SAMN05421876_1279 [Kaistella jeonii]|uniref:Lipoprotein n=1 Tax=Kaistella jeonii TaxID=266749 RepID=A0A0C1CML3_9FLAO|nr:hypothetical protein OA86_15115 [Kaistella jeonii]SFC44947.1 hypothetical protein SAMN05421876_1279 [Kaistella jeonii]VEI96515.1 Uncharacterised protein [Kaistella jeonii]
MLKFSISYLFLLFLIFGCNKAQQVAETQVIKGENDIELSQNTSANNVLNNNNNNNNEGQLDSKKSIEILFYPHFSRPQLAVS